MTPTKKSQPVKKEKPAEEEKPAENSDPVQEFWRQIRAYVALGHDNQQSVLCKSFLARGEEFIQVQPSTKYPGAVIVRVTAYEGMTFHKTLYRPAMRVHRNTGIAGSSSCIADFQPVTLGLPR